MEQELTTTTTQQPTATLEVLTLEVKFYLNQTAQNIIEVGKRLAQAKALVPHGEWGNWLESNFSLTDRTARNFMQCAERFGKTEIDFRFKPTQMIAMLSLPEAETEQFIEEKAAAGKPVEDMTVKELREEIQQWKSRAEVNENALKESQLDLQDARNAITKVNDRCAQLTSERDKARQALKDQKPIIQTPADYEENKRAIRRLEGEKIALQKRLEDAAHKVEVPADYHANKKKLAELDSKIAEMQKQIDAQIIAEEYATVAQKLDAISQLIRDLINSPNAGRAIAEYERNNAERYGLICANFQDFMRIMEME